MKKSIILIDAFLYLCSIKNNNSLTPAQLAAACGYQECAQFLESASQQQETHLAKGVYQNGPNPLMNPITSPSPLDITASNNKVEPCVISQGLNGGCLPPPTNISNGEGMECAMEEGDNEMGQQQAQALITGTTSKDITIDRGVSMNCVPVAGRKRCREDVEEMEFKRIRRLGKWHVITHTVPA